MMAYGHPSNASPEDWYEAAKNVDQNHAAIEAFKLAYRAPGPIPTHLTATPIHVASQSIFCPQAATPAHSTPGNHVPTDIDGGQQKNPISLTCYRCHQPSHKVPDCPLNFDIRSMMLQLFLLHFHFLLLFPLIHSLLLHERTAFILL